MGKENDEKNKLKAIFEISDLLYSKVKDENLSNWEKNLSKIEKEQQHDARCLTARQANLLFVERAMKWLTATIPNRLTLDLQNVEKVMNPIKKSVYKKILKRASKTIEEEMENISNILEKLCNSHTTFNMVELMLVDEKVYLEKHRLLKSAKIDIEIHQKTSGLKNREIEHIGGQKKNYENYEYKCFDKIHIPGTSSIYRSNEIIVNEIKIKIGDSLFLLLLRLAVELKKGEGGWVNISTLHIDRIITDPNKYQIYSRLRTTLQGSLIDKDGKKFIENDGSKNYRISTHPDFITYNKKKLLNHKDPDIKRLAEELPDNDK